MQGIKIHGYYGVSIPMLLGAPEDVVHSVLTAATNGFSSRLLHNLYEEGRSLQYTLYDSGRFNFAIDENSRQAKNLINYTDFSVAYNKHMEALNAGSISAPKLEELPSIDLDSLDAELPSLTSEFTEVLSDLPSLGVDEIAGETDLFGSGESSIDLDAAASQTIAGVEGLALNEVSAPANTNVDLASLDFNSLDELTPSASSDGLDSLIAEDSDINTRILQSLQYNIEFYNTFMNGDYLGVLKEIVNWVPSEYTTLRSLRFNTKDAKTLELKQTTLTNISASITELESQPVTELSKIRLDSFRAEREELIAAIAELESHTKYLTPVVLGVIKRERDRLPKRLISNYYALNQSEQVMNTAEYTILTRLHEICSRVVGPQGETRLQLLIAELKDVRNRNIMNSPRFFNQEFSRLSAKEMPSQLMTFNKQYKSYLDTFSGQDLIKILEDGVTSCKLLLESDDDDYTQLLSLFTIDLQLGDSEMKDNDPRRFELKGLGSIDYAVELIMSKPEIYADMMLGSEPPDAKILKQMIELLYDSNKIIELCKSRESFAALYRIFHFITKYSGSTMLSQLGMLLTDEEDNTISYTIDDWRMFTAKFGILGFYNFPIQMFTKCCDINVLVSNSKRTVIRKEQRPRLFANIGIIQRFLLSRQVAITNSYPIAAY